MTVKYVELEALRNKLYNEDAITMKGVAIINTFPTVELITATREVVEAQPYFKKHYRKYCCSNCKCEVKTADVYCSKCGARLIEVEDNS